MRDKYTGALVAGQRHPALRGTSLPQINDEVASHFADWRGEEEQNFLTLLQRKLDSLHLASGDADGRGLRVSYKKNGAILPKAPGGPAAYYGVPTVWSQIHDVSLTTRMKAALTHLQSTFYRDGPITCCETLGELLETAGNDFENLIRGLLEPVNPVNIHNRAEWIGPICGLIDVAKRLEGAVISLKEADSSHDRLCELCQRTVRSTNTSFCPKHHDYKLRRHSQNPARKKNAPSSSLFFETNTTFFYNFLRCLEPTDFPDHLPFHHAGIKTFLDDLPASDSRNTADQISVARKARHMFSVSYKGLEIKELVDQELLRLKTFNSFCDPETMKQDPLKVSASRKSLAQSLGRLGDLVSEDTQSMWADTACEANDPEQWIRRCAELLDDRDLPTVIAHDLKTLHRFVRLTKLNLMKAMIEDRPLPNAKLNDADWDCILQRKKNGESVKAMADKYGVTVQAIYQKEKRRMRRK